MLNGQFAEGDAAGGDGPGEAQGKPGFAEFGSGGEEGETFGEEVGNDLIDFGEVGVEEVGQADEGGDAGAELVAGLLR